MPATQGPAAPPLIAAMLRGALDVKVHWSVLDYVQRAARHLASKTDVDLAYAALNPRLRHG